MSKSTCVITVTILFNFFIMLFVTYTLGLGNLLLKNLRFRDLEDMVPPRAGFDYITRRALKARGSNSKLI